MAYRSFPQYRILRQAFAVAPSANHLLVASASGSSSDGDHFNTVKASPSTKYIRPHAGSLPFPLKVERHAAGLRVGRSIFIHGRSTRGGTSKANAAKALSLLKTVASFPAGNLALLHVHGAPRKLTIYAHEHYGKPITHDGHDGCSIYFGVDDVHVAELVLSPNQSTFFTVPTDVPLLHELRHVHDHNLGRHTGSTDFVHGPDEVKAIRGGYPDENSYMQERGMNVHRVFNIPECFPGPFFEGPPS